MTIATDPLDRPAWLEWRREGVGASDVAAILGISPWASPWTVWADKTGLLPPSPDNETFEFGRWAELMLGPWFTDKTNLYLIGQQARAEHPDQARHRTTLDGVVVEWEAVDDLERHSDTPGLLLDHALGTGEIKTDFNGTPWQAIPAHYQTQGQWQLHVTGLDRVWFIVLHGRRMRTYTLERNQDDIDFMVDKVDDFWDRHVVTQSPPDIDSSEATARALAAVYPKADKAGSVELTTDQATALIDYRFGKADEKAGKARARTASNILRAAAGDAYELTVNGERVVTLGSQTKKTTCKHCGVVDESNPFRVLRPSKPKKETS